MGIVPLHDPGKQKRQNEMARKALLLTERTRRKNANGYVSAENAEEALIAAGIKDAPPEPAQDPVRLIRLEAAQRHGLTLKQAEAMTGTTEAEVEAEAVALIPVPPGDGGARTPVPPVDPLVEAELAGDWATAMRIKNARFINRENN